MPNPHDPKRATTFALVHLSGGKCYWPTPRCNQPVTVFINREAVTNLEIAHIRAAERGGAHWFPWQIETPTVNMQLTTDGVSTSAWNATVGNLINFLNENYTKVVHVKLDLLGAATRPPVNEPARYLYGQRTDGGSGPILAIGLGTSCVGRFAFTCNILDIQLAPGPGSALGYITQNSANNMDISGFYQVGATACQTGACTVTLIPVEPVG